ncbi:hypothetical protein HY504_03725 [Candidatus Wolfebacteria bacterium]|nr:hypothetical protein [Candidatus Wolfebacteria bacterium]
MGGDRRRAAHGGRQTTRIATDVQRPSRVIKQGGVVRGKKTITAGMRYIKSYDGPSRIWFAYQDSLSEGSHRLSRAISELPVSAQTARLLVDMLLRLDERLSVGGIDDSDGTVGGFVEETVQVLREYARLDPSVIAAFRVLRGKETSFGWEEPLVALLDGKEY